MGEIKSTLDIIMEKTKGMNPTKEEKEAFRKTETKRQAKGWVQKFMDGSLNAARIRGEMARLDEIRLKTVRECIISESLYRMDPEGDNASVLRLLEEAVEIDAGPVRQLLEQTKKRLDKEKTAYEREFKDILRMEGISGSAVVPNLWSYRPWQEQLQARAAEFQEKAMRLLK